MIDDSLLIRYILAFAVGSLWVTLVTIIAERRNSAVGGILGGLPSTSAFAFLFIGLNQSSPAAVQATTVFPLVFSITSAFLLFYAFFARKGFTVGFTISLLIWFLISSIIVLSGLKDFTFCLASGVLISAAVYYLFAKRLNLEKLTGKKRPYTPMQILGRAIGAGSLVFLAVLLSQMGGPIIGGIASAFPAIFSSTLIILYKSEGTEFSRSMTKPLVISGILTVIPYGVAVRYMYPSLGIWLGTLSSYALIAPLAVLSYFILQPKGKQDQRE
jgi:uncharacterized membrane protein (GlpM family)